MTEQTKLDATAARLIISERTDRWAIVLRRELDWPAGRVCQCRSVAECWETLAASPASFLIIELTKGNAERLLERMARLPRDFPLARVAVVADRSLAPGEWLMREAGAVHFTTSPRRLGSLAAAVGRHLEQVPRPPQGLAERIWATLPWGRKE